MPEKKSPENKPAVADALNALLADSFALYLKTKNYHWHVQGPRFRDLHLLFDEQAAQILATIDPIAERVRKNGAPTLRSIGAIRSEERRVGKECVSTCRSRWSRFHLTQKNIE